MAGTALPNLLDLTLQSQVLKPQPDSQDLWESQILGPVLSIIHDLSGRKDEWKPRAMCVAFKKKRFLHLHSARGL